MTNRHKHADMIIAKANNMDLVVFTKLPNTSRWKLIEHDELPKFYRDCYMFMCLPQHKEACLHWLNGGEVQPSKSITWTAGKSIKWSVDSPFMSDNYVISIKPRKEKRWIGITHEGSLTQLHYSSIDELKKSAYASNNFNGWQFLEIEIEVEV